jgi:hypothetical protein
VTAIATGYGHCLALRKHAVYSWGENFKGQLGNGSGETGSDVPLRVSGLSQPQAIAAGDEFSMAQERRKPEKLPTITRLEPSNGPESGRTEVAITGTNFQNVREVSFGEEGRASFTVRSKTLITAVAPSSFIGGPVRVSVATRAGLSPSDQGDIYFYVSEFPPSVYAVEPATGPESGGTRVSIHGSRMAEATSVTFGTAPAAFTVKSGSTIEATAPPGKGEVDVRVTTPQGTSGVVRNGDVFTYHP